MIAQAAAVILLLIVALMVAMPEIPAGIKAALTGAQQQ